MRSVLTAPEGLRERLRKLKTPELVRTCAGFRIAVDDDSLTAIVRLALRELAQRIMQLRTQFKTVVARLHRITKTTAPALVAIHGVGPDVASTLLLTAGDNPHRLHSEASFAALCGASPLPATSGKKQNRHRLNHGGDRHANAALWRIAIVRLSHDQRTKDYVARRTTNGKNTGEILRCLKRYIAREVFAALPRQLLETAPQPSRFLT